ncbi:uncharacterized protein LOC131689432 [Topomyia yanbarensis]|uniref:uncharacterized protein LOC131689432 n=1 Tax=Topomyia yanbarensis TaxID=2498891 RepID=UPI00273C46A3|nr:uncharacterized protein LOC131689432 [Topomyia yanbarensis]
MLRNPQSCSATTLLVMSLISLISVFSYVLLLVLFGTVSFRIYKNVLQAVQKTFEGHLFKEYLDFDLTLSQEKVQQLTTVAVAHANALLSELRLLFLVEDVIDSIKFGTNYMLYHCWMDSPEIWHVYNLPSGATFASAELQYSREVLYRTADPNGYGTVQAVDTCDPANRDKHQCRSVLVIVSRFNAESFRRAIFY